MKKIEFIRNITLTTTGILLIISAIIILLAEIEIKPYIVAGATIGALALMFTMEGAKGLEEMQNQKQKTKKK